MCCPRATTTPTTCRRKDPPLIADDFQAAFQQCDLIAGPVAPSVAPQLGAQTDPVSSYLADIYTLPASLAGLPGMSVPAGFGGAGLPVGLQLIGNHFQEGRLLNAAHQLQLATDHHLRRPEGLTMSTQLIQGLRGRHRLLDARPAGHAIQDLQPRQHRLWRRAQYPGQRRRSGPARHPAGDEPEAVACAINWDWLFGSPHCARERFCPQELLLPGPAQGLPDQPVRDPGGAGRRGVVLLARTKTVRLVRAHLEEDAGKSLHEEFHGMSGIDLNRAGTPLLEIVTEPDMRGSEEAVAYAKALHQIVTWIGICDGNMQEGRSAATPTSACASPARRWARARDQEPEQLQEHAAGDRLRDPLADRTTGGRPQNPAGHRAVQPRHRRDARHAHQGGRGRLPLLPDPDLPPLRIAASWMETGQGCHARAAARHGGALRGAIRPAEYDATTLTQSRAMAAYFEQAAQACGQAKLASNWIMGEISRRLNAEESAWRQ